MMAMLLFAMLLILGSLVTALAATVPFVRTIGRTIDCWADSVQGDDPHSA